MKSRVVLVTGAAGFAGGHLLEHLAGIRDAGAGSRDPGSGIPDAGSADLVGWSRSVPTPVIARLARWQQVDILDRDQVNTAIAAIRPDEVYHCAGLPHVAESWGDTASALAANVLGTHRLLEAVERLESRCRILITGSAQVYAPSDEPITEEHTIAPSSPYALSKLAQEQLALRAAGSAVEIIVTRPFNHTGPRQKPSFLAPAVARQIALIERGMLEPVIRVGNLETVRDVIDVRDAVRAYAALMTSGTPGTIYNVASGTGRPVRTIVEALVAKSRVPVRIEQDPSRFRPSDVSVLIGSPRRLQDATGWTPEVTFDRMIGDLLESWRTLEVLGP